MDQDNRNTAGAPSNDTTSALFVSARKKQLEQQEAERRAREKEEQRLAAEAEVRRLEREVEERRRKTEEDAKNAEEEARRVAAESRAKMAEAAENPDAVLGAQGTGKGARLPQMPKTPAASPKAAASSGGEAAAKAPLNVKLLAIIGGGAALLAVIIIVLVMALGGGGEDDMSYGDTAYEDVGGGMYYGEFFSFECPEYWYVTGLDDAETLAGRVAVSPSEEFVESSDIGSLPFVVIADYSAAFEAAGVETMDDLLAAFTDDMVNALSLTDYLGEPTDVQYQEAEELPDGSGMGYSVVLVFGDVSCFSQIALTNEGRVHGSLAMGLADGDAENINVILTTIEPTEG